MGDSDATTARETPEGYEGGQGTPLLLLHGIGGSWHIWKPVLDGLGRHHRVFALTLPGHDGGPGYAAPGDATVAGMAEQLIAMMKARGVTRAHVVGNSLGGWLAIELARRGFARSVTALSPAGGWAQARHYHHIARRFRFFYALMPLILLLASPFLRFAAFRRALGRETMEHGERMSAPAFRASLRAMTRTQVFRPLLRTMGRDGPIAPLAATVPVRIAWCECDRVIPFDTYGKPVLDSIPAAERSIIRGAGHVPMYDEPGQVIEQVLEVTAGAERREAAAT